MDNLIRKLYGMQIDGKFDAFMEKYRDKKDEAYKEYQELRRKLSKEQADELDHMMDRNMEIFPLEMEESFVEGFKLGVRLMCEVFGKEEA